MNTEESYDINDMVRLVNIIEKYNNNLTII